MGRLGLQAPAAALLAFMAFSFGTPALAVSDSPFLPLKTTVPAPSGAAELCRRYSWACEVSGQGRTLRRPDIDIAAAINRRVNRGVVEISDHVQYGRTDYWALPTARGGDCEDIALLKKMELIRAGFPPEHLLLATALTRERVPHAVLVLRTEAGDFVMDNLDDRIRSWSATGYTYLRVQDPASPRQWRAVRVTGD